MIMHTWEGVNEEKEGYRLRNEAKILQIVLEMISAQASLYYMTSDIKIVSTDHSRRGVKFDGKGYTRVQKDINNFFEAQFLANCFGDESFIGLPE